MRLYRVISIKALQTSLKIEILCSIKHQRCTAGTNNRIEVKRTMMGHLRIPLSKLSGLWRVFRANSIAERANKTRRYIHLQMKLLLPHHSVLEASTNQSFGQEASPQKERCGRSALCTLQHLKAPDYSRPHKTLWWFSQMVKTLTLIHWILINLNLCVLKTMIHSAEKLGKLCLNITPSIQVTNIKGQSHILVERIS